MSPTKHSSKSSDLGDESPVKKRSQAVEDVDAMRHKEIMWKAVAGVLFLLLKYLKANST
jgi:hypothetical protein